MIYQGELFPLVFRWEIKKVGYTPCGFNSFSYLCSAVVRTTPLRIKNKLAYKLFSINIIHYGLYRNNNNGLWNPSRKFF